jgi:sarcosine oxidase, subunit beta
VAGSSVVIIGGGVSGLSTAYHLAGAGVERVAVLEKATVGDGSSSRAAAIITGHLWTKTGVEVRKLALRRFRELSQELAGYRFHDVGCLNLFDSASWREREPLLDLYRRLNIPFEITSAADINHRWPALTVPDDIIGLHDPLGGYSEPETYLNALQLHLRPSRAELREGVTVTGLLRRDGRACGVHTTRGDVAADAVVCCSFAWTNRLLADAGIELPVKSFVHQRYTTTALPQPISIPAINANPLGGYARPAAGNRVLLGIETPDREEHHVDSPEFRMSQLAADPALADEIHARFRAILPALASTTIEDRRVGLITFSMDHEPLLGPVRAIPGLYVAAGFHSGGFAYNPATGALLAELITHGQTSIDISAFAPDRFDQSRAGAYLAHTLRQADTAKVRH